MTTTSAKAVNSPEIIRLQRRTLIVLSVAQVVSGIGVAVGLALSALVVTRMSGSEAIGGLAGTAAVLGAALLAIPVARAGARSGRRAGLILAYGVATLGAVISVLAIQAGWWPLLLGGLVLLGGGSAGNLAARYSAADLAPPGAAARHLSLVIWATTVGSVTGPNLAEPADRAGTALGLAVNAGGFALAAVMYLISTVVIAAALRPDPLHVARSLDAAADTGGKSGGTAAAGRGGGTVRTGWQVLRESRTARRAITAIAVSHTAMVSIMSMTPVHLDHGGATISVIGVVISLHIAGMYVLSPVVGWLADRIGRVPVLLLGMGQLLAAAALAGSAGAHGVPQVAVGLTLLGTGWSCGLVAGSAMLTESAPAERRPAVQGMSDMLMNVCGAGGTVIAGMIVGSFSYGVLGAAVAVLVAATAAWLALPGRRAHLASA
mgnify:CR=1 FL=1